MALAKQPDSLIKAANLRSLGEALRVVGDLEEADVNLKESLKIAQALQSPDAISAAYLLYQFTKFLLPILF